VVSTLASRLRASRLFGALDPSWLERFAREATLRHLVEGELVWRTADPAVAFTVIQRGLVQIVRPTPGGERATLGVFGPHESIGDVAVLEGAPYPADAVALSPSVEVIRVPAGPVLAAHEADAALARALQRSLLEHTRALRSKIDILSAGGVPARLAALLRHLADRFGDELEDGTVFVPVPLSRAALASLVSARVETVIRVMSRWQKAAAVRSTDDGFALDLAALDEAARG
jgi:CRP-like cAMP-binding protein